MVSHSRQVKSGTDLSDSVIFNGLTQYYAGIKSPDFADRELHDPRFLYYGGIMNALKPPAEKSSLNAADWEQAALEMIADKGLGALGVEPLARRLGITKGSFYWHFSSRDELLRRALTRWETHDLEHLTAALEGAQPPAKRLADFIRRTSRQNLTHRVYAALCAAPDHPRVGRLLRRVTRRRMDYLVAVFSEMGLTEPQARYRGHLAYAAYMGYLQLEAQGHAPERSEPDFEAYVEHAISVLLHSDA